MLGDLPLNPDVNLEDTGFSRIWNFFQFGDTEEIFFSGT
jgi:hypothetical protein